MPPPPVQLLVPTSLAGARIWVAGAAPDGDGATDADRERVAGFLRTFAAQVFSRGGHLVHGSHPTFTPLLLEEAERYQKAGGSRDSLILAVSRFWSKDEGSAPVSAWRRNAIVYETPAVGTDRDASLEALRKWLASRCDAVVAVGGNWWTPVGGRAGLPIEVELAIGRGIPCFLLGGLGGAAKDYLAQNPGVLKHLKNGLDESVNAELATQTDIAALAEKVCAQLARLPLVRGRGSDGASFRILALDGGGVRGAFTASVLTTWEKQTNLAITDHFDLVAGTSAGGILAIALGLGLTAQQVLDFYLRRGPVIFPVTRLKGRLSHGIRHLFKPKYSQEVLLRELEAAYYQGGAPVCLKASRCRLVIPTYHAVAGASHVLRTPHHPDLNADSAVEAAHAALATAAAPTYFTAAKIANMVAESSYFDGGVWANSPVLAAIIEAVCFLRVPLERIDVLSVGTTDEPFTVRKQTKAGIAGWLSKGRLLDLLMNVQQESSLKLAKTLMGETRFLRVNTTTPPGAYTLDGAGEIGELADLGNRAAGEPSTLSEIKSRFLNGVPVAPWERF